MADEATTTDETNSAPTPMADAGTPDPNSSATTQSDGDALDGGVSILGDAAAGEGGDADAGAEKPQGDGGEGADANAGADENPLIGAPEGDYDLSGVLPKGTTIDAEALAAITPTAKELNLSPAGLAKLVAEGQPILAKQVQDGIVADVVRQRAEWDAATRLMIQGGKDGEGNDVRPDPVFNGKSFDQVMVASAKAIDRFGGAGFREFLKETGLGNDPRMVQFAYQAGVLISEDTSFERGGGIPNTPKSREEKYYGSA